jgi:hypothetical protein
VTVSAPGHVDRAGRPVGSVTAQVQPGQLWRSTLEYDSSATIQATFATEPGYVGYALPATNDIPISLGNSDLPAGSKAFPGTGNARTLANLWPYPTGYQVWAGRCQNNDPRFSGQPQDPPVPSAPGDTSAVVVLLGPVEIKTTGAKTVTATATGTCPAGTTNVVQLGSTNAAGVLKTSLPYGTWSIKAGSGAAKPATVAKGQPQPIPPLVLP